MPLTTKTDLLLDDAFNLIRQKRPSLVYVGGKTCTGKSTFAHRLRDELGFDSVSLDEIVAESIIEPQGIVDRGGVFVEVYRNRERLDWINQFVDAVMRRVSANLAWGRNTVIDGAIANPETLADLTRKWFKFTFVYLHPEDIDRYVNNLVARMQATHPHLPKRFWESIDADDLQAFQQSRTLTFGMLHSIEQYAKASQQESLDRLAGFSKMYQNLTVVEI